MGVPLEVTVSCPVCRSFDELFHHWWTLSSSWLSVTLHWRSSELHRQTSSCRLHLCCIQRKHHTVHQYPSHVSVIEHPTCHNSPDNSLCPSQWWNRPETGHWICRLDYQPLFGKGACAGTTRESGGNRAYWMWCSIKTKCWIENVSS